MNFLSAVVLGIVEGFTEFLPVSSTGHLILASNLLKIPDSDFLTSFEIAIQLGAILAVIALYPRRLFHDAATIRRVAVAFLPSAVVGLILYKFIKHTLLGSEAVVVWSLALGGAFIIVFERLHRKMPIQRSGPGDFSYSKAFLIGVCQAVSVIPGVSRAAATILGGMALGLPRKTIVEFSFLLAVPTMLAATALDIYNSGASIRGGEWGLLAAGFIVSFVVATVGIRFLIRFIERHDLTAFGVYRIAVAILFWLAAR